MRTRIHRKERDKWIVLGTAVVYVKDSGEWRETTKAEGEILEIQSQMTPGSLPAGLSVHLPKAAEGSDGDYYAVLYPLGRDGQVWDGEVWSPTQGDEGDYV